MEAGWYGRSRGEPRQTTGSPTRSYRKKLMKTHCWTRMGSTESVVKQNKKIRCFVCFPYGICWIHHEKGPSQIFAGCLSSWNTLNYHYIKFDCHFAFVTSLFCDIPNMEKPSPIKSRYWFSFGGLVTSRVTNQCWDSCTVFSYTAATRLSSKQVTVWTYLSIMFVSFSGFGCH